uniref:Uncharacterized protein n=1 Tax=Chromera velia CCMP2878 TaxID=1169474 RepID=A0A0G4FVE9_9ALVE|eukprot:Cvel_18982.t1-p1 / transcript=Cvel_18982.t1 / gene=Cvel_18982 / organism=Chromera_velia_CCMP2878 / gene_product=hypothetical protein / transcript_product=hypothetical protein / location=Cvel_scaffold1605:20541-33189(-) / protein_length=1345 / sequence_SO=supercontig / SO=protein_coding / is_pseudo=false
MTGATQRSILIACLAVLAYPVGSFLSEEDFQVDITTTTTLTTEEMESKIPFWQKWSAVVATALVVYGAGQLLSMSMTWAFTREHLLLLRGPFDKLAVAGLVGALDVIMTTLNLMPLDRGGSVAFLLGGVLSGGGDDGHEYDASRAGAAPVTRQEEEAAEVFAIQTPEATLPALVLFTSRVPFQQVSMKLVGKVNPMLVFPSVNKKVDVRDEVTVIKLIYSSSVSPFLNDSWELPKTRLFPMKSLYGTENPTTVELLFPFWRNGPFFLMSCLQMMLLTLTALEAAIIRELFYNDELFGLETTYESLALIPLTLIPLMASTLIFVPQSLTLLSLLTSIDTMGEDRQEEIEATLDEYLASQHTTSRKLFRWMKVKSALELLAKRTAKHGELSLALPDALRLMSSRLRKDLTTAVLALEGGKKRLRGAAVEPTSADRRDSRYKEDEDAMQSLRDGDETTRSMPTEREGKHRWQDKALKKAKIDGLKFRTILHALGFEVEMRATVCMEVSRFCKLDESTLNFKETAALVVTLHEATTTCDIDSICEWLEEKFPGLDPHTISLRDLCYRARAALDLPCNPHDILDMLQLLGILKPINFTRLWARSMTKAEAGGGGSDDDGLSRRGSLISRRDSQMSGGGGGRGRAGSNGSHQGSGDGQGGASPGSRRGKTLSKNLLKDLERKHSVVGGRKYSASEHSVGGGVRSRAGSLDGSDLWGSEMGSVSGFENLGVEMQVETAAIKKWLYACASMEGDDITNVNLNDAAELAELMGLPGDLFGTEVQATSTTMLREKSVKITVGSKAAENDDGQDPLLVSPSPSQKKGTPFTGAQNRIAQVKLANGQTMDVDLDGAVDLAQQLSKKVAKLHGLKQQQAEKEAEVSTLRADVLKMKMERDKLGEQYEQRVDKIMVELDNQKKNEGVAGFLTFRRIEILRLQQGGIYFLKVKVPCFPEENGKSAVQTLETPETRERGGEASTDIYQSCTICYVRALPTNPVPELFFDLWHNADGRNRKVSSTSLTLAQCVESGRQVSDQSTTDAPQGSGGKISIDLHPKEGDAAAAAEKGGDEQDSQRNERKRIAKLSLYLHWKDFGESEPAGASKSSPSRTDRERAGVGGMSTDAGSPTPIRRGREGEEDGFSRGDAQMDSYKNFEPLEPPPVPPRQFEEEPESFGAAIPSRAAEPSEVGTFVTDAAGSSVSKKEKKKSKDKDKDKERDRGESGERDKPETIGRRKSARADEDEEEDDPANDFFFGLSRDKEKSSSGRDRDKASEQEGGTQVQDNTEAILRRLKSRGSSKANLEVPDGNTGDGESSVASSRRSKKEKKKKKDKSRDTDSRRPSGTSEAAGGAFFDLLK